MRVCSAWTAYRYSSRVRVGLSMVISDLAQVRTARAWRSPPLTVQIFHHCTPLAFQHHHLLYGCCSIWSTSDEFPGRRSTSSESYMTWSSPPRLIIPRNSAVSLGLVLRADNADRQMSVYLSSPSCPAFLPLLHGILTASLLPQPTSGAEMMSTRMTCAMALVRFVNGMVDPLQTGRSRTAVSCP